MSSLKERSNLMKRIALKEIGEKFVIEIGTGKNPIKLHVSWIEMNMTVCGKVKGTLILNSFK